MIAGDSGARPTWVWKFGGSSVATPERLRAVGAKVAAAAEGARLAVVVSAMGKTTDQLLGLARETSPGLHRRELDMLLTSGERISMALLAMAVRDAGREAVSLTGSQAGIVTTSDHNQARIIEVRPQRVREALDTGAVVIVGGFQGVSVDKEVTTLGRGGSDTTAVALAASLGAECTIWSDVDGVYDADPRVVDDARRLDVLTHDFVLELGLRGAKVLAPEAVDHARRWGVTIKADSTFAPGRGTILCAHAPPGEGRAVAVTADALAVPVHLSGPWAAQADFIQRWEELGLVLRDLHSSGDAVVHTTFLVDPRNTASAPQELASATARAAASGLRCEVHEDRRSIAIVAEGIADLAQLRRRVCAAMTEGGVPQWRVRTTGLVVAMDVPKDRLDDAVRLAHAAGR